jgi:potassium-transporting ATPase KdpC subunit
MKKALIPAVSSMLVLTVLLGILYPLVVAGIGQGLFPGNANGQQIHLDGKLIGSKLIGQSFTGHPAYFQSRPSGTSPADNDAATAFANLGPNDRATEQAIATQVRAYLKLNRPYDPGLTVARIPVDAVDTSASGVDPDISPANADIQAHRVAAVRHLPLATVMAEVRAHTQGRALGFSGEPSVNVLELNLALDRAQHKGQA